jgi:hypothetical protein
LEAREVTIITGNQDNVCEMMSAADAEDRCGICGGALTVPYMAWMCHGTERGWLFFCGQCCEWIKRGFALDLQGTVNIRALRRMGFNNRRAQKAAIASGFLFSGTNSKQ